MKLGNEIVQSETKALENQQSKSKSPPISRIKSPSRAIIPNQNLNQQQSQPTQEPQNIKENRVSSSPTARKLFGIVPARIKSPTKQQAVQSQQSSQQQSQQPVNVIVNTEKKIPGFIPTSFGKKQANKVFGHPNPNINQTSNTNTSPNTNSNTNINLGANLTPNANVNTQQPKKIIRTIIMKSNFGYGMDITSTLSGQTKISKLKDLPNGKPSPAIVATPGLKVNDVIISVNNHKNLKFNEIVKTISNSIDSIELIVERE